MLKHFNFKNIIEIAKNMQIRTKQDEIPLEKLVAPSSTEESVIKTAANDEKPEEAKKTMSQDALLAALFGANSEICLLTDLEKSTKQFSIALAKDGIWENRTNKIGSFIFRRKEMEVPYATNTIVPKFTMKLPKIPKGFLDATAKLFQKIMQKMSNSESMIQIFWNDITKEYITYVPEQYVAGASIKFVHSQTNQNDPNLTWVLDIHSHNTMGAFFSGGDDRDEKSTRIFGVLGELNKSEYAHKWRAGCAGQYYPLSIWDIFDKDNEVAVVIADSELDKIKPYSEMPDSLREKIVAVGGPSSQFSGPDWRSWQNNRSPQGGTRTWTPQTGWLSGAGSGHMNKKDLKKLQRLQKRYNYLYDSDSDSDRFPRQSGFPGIHGLPFDDDDRPVNGHTKHNDDNYKIIIDCNGDNVSFQSFQALKECMKSLDICLDQGPTSMFENVTDKEFQNGSQALLSLLECTLEELGSTLDVDAEDKMKVDLVDIVVAFAGILVKFPDWKRYVGAMAQEIESHLKRDE